MALAEKKMRLKASGCKDEKQGRFRTTLLVVPIILGAAAQI